VESAIVALTFLAPVEIQWPFVCDVIAAAPDQANALGHIAAGMLEGLLGRHGEAVIERVEVRAALDPKFRRVLSGVWQYMMSDQIFARVRAAAEQAT
jgi:hypothetical protein